MTTFELSRHAVIRKQQMGLDDKTIEDILFRPEITRSAESRVQHECRMHRRGDLAAVIDYEDGIVVTFLPATPEAWERYERPDRPFRREEWTGDAV